MLICEDSDLVHAVLDILNYVPHHENPNRWVRPLPDPWNIPPLDVTLLDGSDTRASFIAKLREVMTLHQGIIFLYTKRERDSHAMARRILKNASGTIFMREMGISGLPEDLRCALIQAFEPYVNTRSVAVSDLTEAMNRSMETYDAEHSRKQAVPSQWECVLHAQSDPVEPGLPVCGICLDKRATICFVECGDMAACDECVRAWASHAQLQFRCPFCRVVVKNIVRPRLSNTANLDGDGH